MIFLIISCKQIIVIEPFSLFLRFCRSNDTDFVVGETAQFVLWSSNIPIQHGTRGARTNSQKAQSQPDLQYYKELLSNTALRESRHCRRYERKTIHYLERQWRFGK